MVRGQLLSCVALALLVASGCSRRDTAEEQGTAAPAEEVTGGGATTSPATGAMTRNPGARASTQFINLNGQQAGRAEMQEGPEGVVVRGEVTGLTPGEHAIHFHQTGRCEPPFETAGEHLAMEGQQHGFLNQHGPHAGDLPNLTADANGRAEFEFYTTPVTIGSGTGGLLGGQGTALIVHAHADDHHTNPSGNSGDRVACAVIGGP